MALFSAAVGKARVDKTAAPEVSLLAVAATPILFAA